MYAYRWYKCKSLRICWLKHYSYIKSCYSIHDYFSLHNEIEVYGMDSLCELFSHEKMGVDSCNKATELLFNSIIMEVKHGISPILLESFYNSFSFSSLDGFFWGACLHIEDKTNSIGCWSNATWQQIDIFFYIYSHSGSQTRKEYSSQGIFCNRFFDIHHKLLFQMCIYLRRRRAGGFVHSCR